MLQRKESKMTDDWSTDIAGNERHVAALAEAEGNTPKVKALRHILKLMKKVQEHKEELESELESEIERELPKH
jgi:uncharacterized protein (UPF0335 family)